ncbi:unnamed protein product [Lathyrus oleraceus]|uniref:F-box/kelch-repeat protein SKIP25 n=1 Tax=Pisum sativum TaxID=3888 RepID=A0A9D5BC15_PEA|nr:F-box/kelch-repeat protein SKIP25 [Pisum sativum]KAI5438305.1 hypothetical protein KIW84_024151 [Pisum sativum]
MANSSSSTTTIITTAKRQKHYHHHHHHHHKDHHHLLIPGLPDHIAQLCLSSINPSLLFKVCHSWRRLIYSPSFPPFFSLYAILSPPKSHHSHSIQFHNFDPISNTWQILPPPPQNTSLQNILLHHPSFLSRNLSVQSISVSDNLILLAATTHNLSPALSHPLIFNPYKGWSSGPALANPRRWCALGTSHDVVYVASGIGSHFSIDVAKSMETWNPINNSNWEKKTEMKDGRFSREAIDAVGWRGKLCMVNVKGEAAKEGIVYDVKEDTWKEMPEGMLSGFRGPVAAMEEEVMYVVDGKGILSRYNPEDDVWEEIFESQRLKGAEQMVAKRGRICVVSTAGISVIDIVADPPRITVVELPDEFEAVAVHVLPRMPVTDFAVQV